MGRAVLPRHAVTVHLTALAWNNAWSNHRLLTACAQLTDVAFVAPRTSFFPSIAATLNHNLTVDWFYVDAIERTLWGLAPNPEAHRFWTPEVPFPRCADLAPAQRAVDLRLVAACRALAGPERPIAVPRRHGVQREPANRLLLHLLQHQVHHRGQAHAMLAGTDVPPPQLDEFFCSGEAPLRADELAALGTSEAEIWGPPRPALVVFSGLPATGKSTLAEALGRRIGATVLSVDPIESAMLDAGIPQGFATGLAAYHVVERLADAALGRGSRVIVDAVNAAEEARATWRRLAAKHGTPLAVVAVRCTDPAVHRARLAARARGLSPSFREPTWEDVRDRADPPWDEAGLVLDTVDPVDANVARLAAWLS